MLKVFRAHLGPEPSQPRFPGAIHQQAQGHPDPWGRRGPHLRWWRGAVLLQTFTAALRFMPVTAVPGTLTVSLITGPAARGLRSPRRSEAWDQDLTPGLSPAEWNLSCEVDRTQRRAQVFSVPRSLSPLPLVRVGSRQTGETEAAGRAFLRHVPASWGFSDGRCGGGKASGSFGSGFLGCLADVPVIP